MSERELFSVTSEGQRETLIRYLNERDLGFWVTVFDKLRTVPQNDRLHPMCRVLSKELTWHGRKLSVDQWKAVFMDQLNAEVMEYVPSIDGKRAVPLGRKTSKLPVSDFNDLMTLVEMFAAEHGVDLKEPGAKEKA